ncbi:hypothetical protein DSN66_26110, partial [Salmonella enterica subsp. enterica serovar Typhimurium]
RQRPTSTDCPLRVEFLCPACEPLINNPGNKKTAPAGMPEYDVKTLRVRPREPKNVTEEVK